mgnify:CR=1 FL=1
MPSAYDLYTFYIEPEDLKGQSHTVKIATTKQEPVFVPQLKRDVQKIVLTFENSKKSMPLNKTQVAALIDFTNTDDFSKWPGTTITLTAGTATNKKQTIIISTHAAPPSNAGPAAASTPPVLA